MSRDVNSSQLNRTRYEPDLQKDECDNQKSRDEKWLDGVYMQDLKRDSVILPTMGFPKKEC